MEKPVIDAAQIVEAAVNNKAVTFDGVSVKGPLDLSHRRFSGVVSITNSEIESLSAEYSSFGDRVCLDGTRITGEASFAGACFEAEVSTVSCVFDANVTMSNVDAKRGIAAATCRFGGQVDAVNLRVGRYAQFDRAEFNGAAQFDASRVEGFLSLSGSRFQGPATFKSTTIDDDLFVTDAVFSAKVEFQESHIGRNAFLQRTMFSGVSFKGATIGGDFDCEACTFSERARMQRLRVAGIAQLSSTRWKQSVNLESANIVGDAMFNSAEFSQEVRLDGFHVGGDLCFPSAKFGGEADFEGAEAHGDMVFEGAVFSGTAKFTGAVAKGQVVFENATFQKDANFDMLTAEQGFFGDSLRCVGKFSFVVATIGNDLDIENGTFESKADFNRTTIKANLFAEGTTFGGNAGFIGTTAGGEARFEKCKFTKKGSTWNLRWSGFNILRIDPDLVDNVPRSPNGKREPYRLDGVAVLINGCTYNRLYAYWKPFLSARSGAVDLQPYSHLESVLKRQGLEDMAARVYYEGHKAVGNAIDPKWGTFDAPRRLLVDIPVDRLLRFVGYGVNSKNLLALAGILVVLGFLVFFQPNSTCKSSKDGTCTTVAASPTWDQSAWLSLRTFLPVDIPAQDQTKPSDAQMSLFGLRMRADYYASLLKILGWIIIPTLIAALAGLLRRGPAA